MDLDTVFDDTYLYFYESFLTPEVNERETELIAKLLELRPALHVLDAPCGHGRIANRLAARGCVTTGLDRSRVALERARRDAAAAGVAVTYVEGDLRALAREPTFDRIVNWFVSFGYEQERDDRELLRAFHAALRPGGKLLIDHANRDLVLRRFQESAVYERDGNYMIDRHRYDVASGRMVAQRTMLRDGQRRTLEYSYRMFTFPELRSWLHDAGFAEVLGYGEDGRKFGLSSTRMIVVAQK